MAATSVRIVSLQPHNAVDDRVVRSLEVHVDRSQSETLRLRYVLNGNLARLQIPSRKPAQRTDELWKHTCFEAFLRDRDGAAYHELNVAPSTEWALYSFNGYRQGRVAADTLHPPAVTVERSAQQLSIDVRLDLKLLPPSRALALAAVIEDENGSLSYWALAHPAGKPDFHHPDSFVLEI
jgi:hypothetical protein